MKKLWLSLLAMLITGCCLAATETVKVPAIETWNIDKKVEFLKLKEGWWLKDGKLEIPGKYTASYGDSVLITMHHTGKGQLIVRLKEFNADGKLLVAWNYCTFINKTGEDRTYSPTYDINNKETKYYTLTLESSQNPNIMTTIRNGRELKLMTKAFFPIARVEVKLLCNGLKKHVTLFLSIFRILQAVFLLPSRKIQHIVIHMEMAENVLFV
ncbi:MAG: hypothetical protein BWY31_01156 [Lentisphaerae bacterium ADurb.Bin242]|nr:MAG: hypothetical protein BWY31_01156 [Lentisphaerae bacterium ADurb.Bin242]